MQQENTMYTFKVQANKDQLERAGLMSEVWEVKNPLRPNMVVREFVTLDSAADQYHTLRMMGMVAFRNWLS
jgi:hypothetical protein